MEKADNQNHALNPSVSSIICSFLENLSLIVKSDAPSPSVLYVKQWYIFRSVSREH